MHLGGLILGVQQALELLRVALQEGLEAARRVGSFITQNDEKSAKTAA